MPSALFLCPEAPYPIRTGGAMRTAALLHYLAQRYTVDAIFFAQPSDPDPRIALPENRIASSATLRLPHHRRDFAQRAVRNASRWLRGIPPLNDRFGRFDTEIARFLGNRRWDLAVVEHSWCAPYATLLRPHAARLILDLHNVESELHSRCAQTEPGAARLLHIRFAAKARALEASWFPQYDLILAASTRDRDRARAIAPAANVEVYPNTVPARALPSIEQKHQIVFSGNLEYHPNRTGVEWFARHVWPSLRDTFPQCEWVLAGKNPHAVRDAVAGPRVRLTGEVEDAIPEIAASMVAIAPLLSGSGTRIKILEAWSAGVPVVSTPIGAEGLPAEGVLLAENPADFAAAVGRLLASDSLRREIAATARSILNANFTWEAGWSVLDTLKV
jgi:glycosyltransferase involved in cell wall biosynthesis